MRGKKHEPTPKERHLVETMAGFGIPEVDIARVIGIDPKTLRAHYRDELDTGHIKANLKVAQNLFRIANGTGREAVTAAIFWLKTRAGWSEYSPAPAARNEPIGKKAAAEQAAVTAADGTGWADLVH